MSKDKLMPSRSVGGSVTRVPLEKGYKPSPVRPGISTATGGFQPASQGTTGNPPSQGSGGKK